MAAPKIGEGAGILERIGGIDALAEAYNDRRRFPNENALAEHLGLSKSSWFKALRREEAMSDVLVLAAYTLLFVTTAGLLFVGWRGPSE